MYNVLNPDSSINAFRAAYTQELSKMLRTPVKHPASSIIKCITENKCKEFSREINLDWAELERIIYKADLAEDDCKFAISNMLYTSSNMKRLDPRYEKIARRYYDLYCLSSALHFIYNSDVLDLATFLREGVPYSVSQYDCEEILTEIPSMYIDIKTKSGYAPFSISVERDGTGYILGREPSEYIKVTVRMPKCNKVDVFDEILCVNVFYVAKNIYPSIIVDNHIRSGGCGDDRLCSHCVPVDYNHNITEVLCEKQGNQLILSKREHISSTPSCFVHKNKINNERCFLAYIKPYDILHIIAYVWDMYKSRHTLERINSKRRGAYAKNEVSIIENDTAVNSNDPLIIPLHNYTKYEREKKPWQGGHHQSPVEHERRSHERILRNDDGSIRKIVQVRGSTINKGGRKAIYKVDEPKSNGKMDLF